MNRNSFLQLFSAAAALMVAAGCVEPIRQPELLRLIPCHRENRQWSTRRTAEPELPPPSGYRWAMFEGKPCLIAKVPALVGMIAAAEASSIGETPTITFTFTETGRQQLENVTAQYVDRQIAVEIDGKIYCAPVVKTPLTAGKLQVVGFRSVQERDEILHKLKSDAP